MEQELRDLLAEGAKAFSIELEDADINCFIRYKEILKEWNEKMNLTAIEEDREVIIKHFIDSLSIAPYLNPRSGTLIDIGTGAGFPGIPIKIVYDSMKVTLLDSLDKRIRFLNEVIEDLRLKEVSAVHGRAEDFGVRPDFREKFDISVARAVSNLPVLLEYCLPFVKTGGLFIAMKGSQTEELDAAAKALETLGGRVEQVREIVLPFTDMRRNIVIIKKIRPTPAKYPRKAGKPAKEPLI